MDIKGSLYPPSKSPSSRFSSSSFSSFLEGGITLGEFFFEKLSNSSLQDTCKTSRYITRRLSLELFNIRRTRTKF